MLCCRYKAKCKRLRAERDVLKEENEAYRKLNLDLQLKVHTRPGKG